MKKIFSIIPIKALLVLLIVFSSISVTYTIIDSQLVSNTSYATTFTLILSVPVVIGFSVIPIIYFICYYKDNNLLKLYKAYFIIHFICYTVIVFFNLVTITSNSLGGKEGSNLLLPYTIMYLVQAVYFLLGMTLSLKSKNKFDIITVIYFFFLLVFDITTLVQYFTVSMLISSIIRLLLTHVISSLIINTDTTIPTVTLLRNRLVMHQHKLDNNEITGDEYEIHRSEIMEKVNKLENNNK